jgi:glycosyltransferase involved in cell wall biosynthesis
MTHVAPTISVVIPAYNAAKYIGNTIKSVLVQDFNDFEIIVVNDGSTDNTLAILEEISDTRLRVIQQINAGVSIARNIGVQKSLAEYIYFLDADDIIAPNALTRCWQVLMQAPEAVAAYGESLTFEADEQIGSLLSASPHVMAKRPAGHVVADLLKQNFICTGAILVRSKAIQQLSGFSKQLKLGEDWVYWLELATLGEFIYLPMPVLCMYRQHPQSAARNLATNSDEMLPAINQAFTLPAVLEHFATDKLVKLRTQTTANALCYSAQELLKQHQWQAARRLYTKSLLLRPFHLRTLILFSCSLFRLIPKFIRKKLK